MKKTTAVCVYTNVNENGIENKRGCWDAKIRLNTYVRWTDLPGGYSEEIFHAKL